MLSVHALRRKIEGDVCCRPCQHFGRFRWSVMMTIHVVANEKSHSRASQSVGCVVPATGKPGDTYGRGGAISKDGHPLLIRILTSCNAGERPCLNGVSRRKCITPCKKLYRVALGHGAWTLCCQLHDGYRDVGVD